MKKRNALHRTLFLFGLLMALSLVYLACGGGNGSTPAATGTSRGVVTGFGSIFVDNVEFKTIGALRKHLDDNTADIAGFDNVVFRKGMIVTVRHGADDNGGTEVEFVNDLEGPIQSVSDNTQTFTVLGVTVMVDNTTATGTQFDNSATNLTFSGAASVSAFLAVNNVVEVSGLPDNNGVLRATYIKFISATPAAGATFEVKGFINNLNLTNKTFNLGLVKGMTTGVVVNYLDNIVKDMPAGGIANGIFVEVRTQSIASPLTATAVEGKGDSEDDAKTNAKMSVEGYIAGLTGTSPNFTFVLNGLTVKTTASTTGVALVVLGAHVEVDGTTLAGALQATKIAARP